MAELSPTESQLIGSRIREARIKRRMSQAELADKAGISLPQISTIENGRCGMKLHSFIRIIEALQVDELLADCSPKELEAILRIVRELRATMLQRDPE